MPAPCQENQHNGVQPCVKPAGRCAGISSRGGLEWTVPKNMFNLFDPFPPISVLVWASSYLTKLTGRRQFPWWELLKSFVGALMMMTMNEVRKRIDPSGESMSSIWRKVWCPFALLYLLFPLFPFMASIPSVSIHSLYLGQHILYLYEGKYQCLSAS